MKKFLILLSSIALAAGCSTDNTDLGTAPEPQGKHITVGATADSQSDATRAHIDRDGNAFTFKWSAGDKISLFNGSTANSELTLTKGADTATGIFEGTAASGGTAITGNYAVYPYKSANEISAEGVLTVNYPAAQTYRADSYGEGANVMVAKSSDMNLNFKNANGFLELKLTGSDIIKYITIRGNNGEKLSGAATITLDSNDTPATTMAANATTFVTLDCGEGVQLSSSVPTSFIIALPPTEFTKGITVDVDNFTFGRMTQSTSNPLTISRNRISPMSAFAFVATQQFNQIEYTATAQVTPHNTDVFGSLFNAEKNTYNAEKSTYNPQTKRGVLVFDGVVKQIGDNAFSGCASLTAIIIPESATSIGDSAFSDCTSLTDITIPEGVTSIGYYAFLNCTSLTNITIPEWVRYIGRNAFYGCTSLTNITIPKWVTYIADYAFFDCTSLTNITIPEGVTEIGDYAFCNCSSLSTISIPEGITHIGGCAFGGCKSLTNITIPKGVKYIESTVFYGCTSLTNITIPEGVTSIGDYAFADCTSLSAITIPESVTSIGNKAFSGCASLTAIAIPEGIKSIGGGAFSGCKSVTTIIIPKGVTSVGESAFSDCTSLSTIIVDPANTVYDSRSNSNAIIETATNTLICGCKNTIIPESVISIGEYAFEYCTSLSAITIPEGVTSIGDYAFAECSALKTVNCLPTTPPSIYSFSPFEGTHPDLVIYVPNTAVEAYKTAEEWSYYYASRIQGQP